MHIDAKELAHGHWHDILSRAGLDSSYLRHGKGGPCPICNDGKDRYMWSNKYGGVYVCRVCSEGKYTSPMNLLMHHMGYTFKEASDYVRAYFGINGSQTDLAAVQRVAQQPRREYHVDPAKSISRMRRQWEATLPVQEGDPVYQYLMRRVPTLTMVPEEIRYHPELEYWSTDEHDKLVCLGKYPAMLVRGFDASNNLVQMHKTYLTSDGRKADVPHVKKTDMGVGCNSFALRIGIPSDTLGVCEGIETGLSASLLKGIPVWPCHSADIMANFELPEEYRGIVRKLVIFADSDQAKNGIRKGEVCAKKLADKCRAMGLRSLITRPAKVGTDFADLAA